MLATQIIREKCWWLPRLRFCPVSIMFEWTRPSPWRSTTWLQPFICVTFLARPKRSLLAESHVMDITGEKCDLFNGVTLKILKRKFHPRGCSLQGFAVSGPLKRVTPAHAGSSPLARRLISPSRRPIHVQSWRLAGNQWLLHWRQVGEPYLISLKLWVNALRL